MDCEIEIVDDQDGSWLVLPNGKRLKMPEVTSVYLSLKDYRRMVDELKYLWTKFQYFIQREDSSAKKNILENINQIHARLKNAFCDKIDDEYKMLKETLVSEIGLYLGGN